MVERGTLSAYGQSIYARYGDIKTGADVDNIFGGGRKEAARYEPGIVNAGADDGAYSAIVIGSRAEVTFYSDNLNRPSLPGELMAHEFIGHYLGGRATLSDGLDESIQAGNLYLQATGMPYYRTSHSGLSHSQGFNPRAIPTFLIGSIPFWQR